MKRIVSFVAHNCMCADLLEYWGMFGSSFILCFSNKPLNFSEKQEKPRDSGMSMVTEMWQDIRIVQVQIIWL